ncbi:TetR/AcrR family transcriptional regulator [Microbacterium sp. NIBRBAC000506063]|uniref:TetR/AcrR family transcriptional regulator n=1 Tax=Microbacterium sp. NIBRBAC000506063 TaxID=2734618 RepID=UPI001BB4DA78|nr:TetR family transcriptional regulator [Microbacterium sp. NIBRBAC000506063]QTV80251.1 TetR family transcriptional regulator [Microbacterium sp. NIBRBAC000506063]
MTEQPRRKRDPEARRAAIVTAAAELITEVGVDAVTHRMVAARADVPLGATTQYFATLDDLRDAALELLVAHIETQMQRMREAFEVRGATATVLAEVLTAALADARSVRADRAVVTAAVHDPKLRAIANSWSQEMIGILEPHYGRDRASAAAVFVDGILWHLQISDDPLPHRIIETALAGILGESDRRTT